MEAKLVPADLQASFRQMSQQLLAQRVEPRDVDWCPQMEAGPVAVGAPARRGAAGHGLIPRSFLRVVDLVVLHCDPDRFALLYRLLWRLVNEPGFAHATDDPDMRRASAMSHAVRREISRQRQRLAFITVEDESGPLPCAWLVPHHHIVEVLANAAAHARCLIASPERAVLRENGRCVAFSGDWREPHSQGEWLALAAGLGTNGRPVDCQPSMPPRK